MKTFLPLAALCAFFLPLQAEEPLPILAFARINTYLNRLGLDDSQYLQPSIPAIITIETIEPKAKTLELDGKPHTYDLLYIKTTIPIDGLPVTFSRTWYQNSNNRKISIKTPKNTSYICLLSPDHLVTLSLCTISRMFPSDVDKIFDNLHPAATPTPEPDIASSLSKAYAAEQPKARVLPKDGDIRLQEIIRYHYKVTLIQRGKMTVAKFMPKGGKPVELLQTDEDIELIPLPDEDYFIVVEHTDIETNTMMFYMVDGLWSQTPSAIACIFKTPETYNVKWSLIRWDSAAGIMTVRRTENHSDINGTDTMDFIIPIR